jgi:hypothetical protein
MAIAPSIVVGCVFTSACAAANRLSQASLVVCSSRAQAAFVTLPSDAN